MSPNWIGWLKKAKKHRLYTWVFFFLFDLILYVPVNNLSVTSGWVFLGWTSTKLGLMCLAQGHNTVTLELVALRSRVKHSTTEPLCSPILDVSWMHSYRLFCLHKLESVKVWKTGSLKWEIHRWKLKNSKILNFWNSNLKTCIFTISILKVNCL